MCVCVCMYVYVCVFHAIQSMSLFIFVIISNFTHLFIYGCGIFLHALTTVQDCMHSLGSDGSCFVGHVGVRAEVIIASFYFYIYL